MLTTSHIKIVPAYENALARCGLTRVDDVLYRTDGQVVAWSRTTESVFIPCMGNDTGFFVKRYSYPTWKKRVRGTFRGTFFGIHRGEAEAHALNAMRGLGIAGVRPVAYGSQRIGRFLAACFLITEAVPHSENLTSYVQRVLRGEYELTLKQRRQHIRQLASQIAHMHEQGFAHGRLFWRNILIRRTPDGDADYFFLDSEPPKGLERIGRGGRWWLWEIAKLATSALPFTSLADRLYFLKCYLGKLPKHSELSVPMLEIDRMARQWIQHERQRIRMNERFDQWTSKLVEEQQSGTNGKCA